jgi:hypothetical protein
VNTPMKSAKLYESVRIASLPSGRRGKHRDLTEGIVRELKAVKEGMALVIPLTKVGGVDLANLRSAVHRAASGAKLEIETQADAENFYVWLRKDVGRTNGTDKKMS